MSTIARACAAAAFIGCASVALEAEASYKAWVSGDGVDTGTCQLATPCKSLQYAISQIDDNGEVHVKDSGSYGTVAITKPVSIVADGVQATISVPQNATGISVDVPNGKVLIRGFTVDGHGMRSTIHDQSQGIFVAAASSVVIERCLIQHLDAGIEIYSGMVFAFDNTISHNINGIDGGLGTLFLKGNEILSNQYGVQTTQGVSYSYGDNEIAGNGIQDVRGSLNGTAKR